MKGFIIFLAVCTLTAAMVPRERRAVDEDASSNTDSTKVECADTTPCGWSIYKDKEKIVETASFLNTYCICKPGTTCQVTEESGGEMNEHKCKPPF